MVQEICIWLKATKIDIEIVRDPKEPSMKNPSARPFFLGHLILEQAKKSDQIAVI